MKKLYIYFSTIILLIVACLAFLAVQPRLFPIESSQVFDAVTPINEQDDAVLVYDSQKKLTEARNNNGNVHAWIYNPGTKIDYPVLQSPDNNSFEKRA